MRILIIIIFLEINSGESPVATAMETEEVEGLLLHQPAANENAGGPDIGDRARAYLAKKKAESISNIRAIFADRIATYDAIKSFNKRKEEALDLDGGADRMSGRYGDFLSGGDGRMGLVNLTVNFGKKTCKSYSFDPENMMCMLCKGTEHRLMTSAFTAGAHAGERIVIFAGDQALPPGWISSNGTCPASVRIEYGSLRDIAEEVIAVTRIWSVPPGSIIFLSSATELLGAGLGHYMADFCSVASVLDGHFYGEVIILPGVPFLLEGTDAPMLVRAMFDMATWICEQTGDLETVAPAFSKMKELLIASGGGEQQPHYPVRYWLTDNAVTAEHAKQSPWCSTGETGIPSKVAAMSEKEEHSPRAKGAPEPGDLSEECMQQVPGHKQQASPHPGGWRQQLGQVGLRTGGVWDHHRTGHNYQLETIQGECGDTRQPREGVRGGGEAICHRLPDARQSVLHGQKD